MDRIADPYRALGVLRGATDAQVKAAHRRLAKRFHPDAPEGDTDRFLAIQEAYLLLSDPLRRREWDRLHAAGPVAAGEPGRSRAKAGGAGPRARTAGAAGRPAGGGASAGAGTAAGAPGEGRTRSRTSDRAGRAGTHPGAEGASGAAAHAEPPPDGSPWGAHDRDPASRSTTWSASGVPWWEDFSPRDKRPGAGGTAGAAGTSGSAGGPGAAGPGGTPRAAGARGHGPAAHATGTQRTTAARSPEDIDVYSRSSGAAWSMAARRYFRKGEAELPKGGAWTYRGTQVVTGAEARKVAAEQAAERRRAAEELLAAARRSADHPMPPRSAFTHEGGEPARPGAAAAPVRPATPPPAPPSRPPAAGAPPAAGTVAPRRAPAAAAPVDRPSLLERVRRAIGKG